MTSSTIPARMPVIEIQNVTKRFAGRAAVDDVPGRSQLISGFGLPRRSPGGGGKLAEWSRVEAGEWVIV